MSSRYAFLPTISRAHRGSHLSDFPTEPRRRRGLCSNHSSSQRRRGQGHSRQDGQRAWRRLMGAKALPRKLSAVEHQKGKLAALRLRDPLHGLPEVVQVLARTRAPTKRPLSNALEPRAWRPQQSHLVIAPRHHRCGRAPAHQGPAALYVQFRTKSSRRYGMPQLENGLVRDSS